MPYLDDHATRELRILLAALTPTAGPVERDAALALLESWADGGLDRREDTGGVGLRNAARGLDLWTTPDGWASITVELMANAQSDAFDRPELLLRGLDPTAGKAAVRERFGPPVDSAYGNDWYLLDGVDATVCLGWRNSGGIQRLMLLRAEPAELRRLRRRAAKLAAATPGATEPPATVIRVPEEDGILGLVDPDAYAASVPGWSFDSLTAHLERETAAGHGVFWRTGTTEHATYAVSIRTSVSDRPAVRETDNVVHATAGRLRLVGWGTITTAADSDDERLPDEPDAEIAAPATRLSVRIRHLASVSDDDGDTPVEIVLRPLGRKRTRPTALLAWWDD